MTALRTRIALIGALALACLATTGGVASPAVGAARCKPVLRTFSGSGAGSIGTLTLARPAVVDWTNTGKKFQILTLTNGGEDATSVLADSSAHSGTLVLDASQYLQARVNAVGRWRLVLSSPCVAATKGPSRFVGNGSTRLGTIRVLRRSVLAWTNTGPSFQILTGQGIPVSSNKREGTTTMLPGTYPNVRVVAVGSWSFRIQAR